MSPIMKITNDVWVELKYNNELELCFMFWLYGKRNWFTDCPEHHITEGAD